MRNNRNKTAISNQQSAMSRYFSLRNMGSVAGFVLMFLVFCNFLNIKEAQAAVAYRSSGTFTAGQGAITPPYPADMAANDVCLLVVTSENEPISLSSSQGFVEVPWSPQSAGTAATDPASRLAVFWKRTVGGDTAPTVADSGDNTEGQIHCFSGVITSGDPWDTGAGGNDGGANDKSGTIPGSTTTVANTLVVLIISSSYNGNSTAQFSGWANADLANITERADNTNTAGLGGGHGMATGEKAAAGAYGTTTVTLANTSYKGAISIALKPPPPTTIVGDGAGTAVSYAGPSNTNKLAGSFTLSTNTGTDTVTEIVISGGAQAYENVATSGAKIYQDNGSTPNQWDSGDTLIASASFAANDTATFSGLNINVTTTSVQYLITYDIKASPTDGNTLTGAVTSITCTNPVTNNDNTDGTMTIDALAPTTTASAGGYTFGTWTATSPISVTLSASDGGSGVASGYPKYCVDTADTCTPATSYTGAFNVTCSAGSTCIQYVRYYSVDNVGNTEGVKSSQVKQDLQGPTAGASFSASAGDGKCTITYDTATDGGSGMNSTTPYKLLRKVSSAPTDCSDAGATVVFNTTYNSPYTDTPLTNGTTYVYRLCYYDALNNNSTHSNTPSCTPSAPAGPTLSAPTEAGYTDYKNPDSGWTTTSFRFKVIYQSSNPPNYVRVCIGDNDDTTSYPCYDMTADTGCGVPYCNGSYSDGEQFVYTPSGIGLGAAQDIRFYFEAQDSGGTTKLPSNAPTTYYTGPSVYLFYGFNMVGVPKDLGTGQSFQSVLYDDTGYYYCYRWDSSGIYSTTGSWVGCASGSNIKTGYGYFVWARSSNYYRLDEPSGVGNVSTSPFDITLDPQEGWNIISNPYNKRIPLCNLSGADCLNSGARVNVVRVGSTEEEVDYKTAVTNGWIESSIYEYVGGSDPYTGRAYNDTPPAVLEPWKAYWIRVAFDDTLNQYTFKLRVYRE